MNAPIYAQPWVIIGITIVAFVLIILVVCKAISSCTDRTPQNLSVYEKKWNRIEKLATRSDTRALAVIYACSLLDHALTSKGYSGETTSERISSAANVFLHNNQVWKIQRLRNRLAHQIEMEPLSQYDTKEALGVVRQALFDLTVLL